MIYGIFHRGSGLGNQLHRYIATRVLALEKGYDFSMINQAGFKGKSFMNLDMGKPNEIAFKTKEPAGKVVQSNFWNKLPLWEEKKVIERGVDIRSYDPEFNFVDDNTIIDGEFQDERYFIHRAKDVNEWLKVEPLDLPEDLCIIGFRGGEFASVRDLFLPPKYWEEAKQIMLEINPNMKFKVSTDDPKTAKEFFPNFEIMTDMGEGWRSVRYAKYLIIPNSSFYILPSLLNEYAKKIIAPRYWARRNTGVWALPQNYYSKFNYI